MGDVCVLQYVMDERYVTRTNTVMTALNVLVASRESIESFDDTLTF